MSESWKVPEGYAPVVRYAGDPEREVVEPGWVRLPEADLPENAQLDFFIGDGPPPALPLRDKGEIRHLGWDIPTRYAIDARGEAWMDNAHGHSLERVPARRLVEAAKDEPTRRRLQRELGLPVDRPAWVTTALAHGWTAPAGWVDPD